MSKYIKSTSTYTLRKKAQNINGGSILERNWTTLEGQKLRFGKGKEVLYADGNFVFTRANIQMPSRRSNTATSVETFTYENVKDAKSQVNNVELNITSDDLRNFAYYGSCVNLIEGSITNIIKMFPGCLYVSNRNVEYPLENGNFDNIVDVDGSPLYAIDNPFNIDVLSKTIDLTTVDNRYRYLCESYDEYELNDEKLISYNVDYVFDKCKEVDQWYNFITYREEFNRKAPIIINFVVESGKSFEVIGYRYGNDMIFLSRNQFVLKPNDDVIENYFDNLKGFEKQLLTRKSKPLYTNTFVTPIENNERYYYVKRVYSWPTIFNYCIDITSTSYTSYVQGLLNIANVYDEIWTNNLYNRMTHEAIKNFDWTYTKEYVNGEEQDNIEGGLQMQRILYFIGNVFDNIKLYIDGIKNSNNITYDGNNNMPDALISDKTEMMGWDTVSVIPSLEDKSVITLNESFLSENGLKWFNGLDCGGTNSTNIDVSFMRRLLLSSKKILSSKGTIGAIEMIMGMFGLGRNNETNDTNGQKEDFEVFERQYKVQVYPSKNENLENDIIEINANRYTTVYDDPNVFQGLPLNYLMNNDNEYIIPFFDKDKDYGHDLYFQGKGGWGNLASNKDIDEYCETISYLKVVSTFGGLTATSSLDVNKEDIYYVVDISDVPGINDESISQNMTHFFYFNGKYVSTSIIGAWTNILKNDENSIDNTTRKMYKKAMYLNSIINTSFGNNPHVGYGLYDNGQYFIDYMTQPFKYYIEDGQFDESVTGKAEKIIFNYDVIDNEPKYITENTLNEKYLKAEGSMNSYYLLNSKIVIIKNKINNNFYKTYFRNSILPYLMQVIPSTTILILEDF